jgi:hypothetical protein
MFFLVLGIVLIAIVLWEAFETIVLPRRVTRRFRLTRFFYLTTWRLWSRVIGRIRKKRRRETLLSVFGPSSLLVLLGIWAGGLILGFGLIQYGLGSRLALAGEPASWAIDVYMSGTTFFTLGLGDVTPTNWAARVLTVLEGGTGFGFLAIVIGYLPVIYQSFSRREVIISMLDARAGSPPSAAELLRRHSQDRAFDALIELLRDWEEWSAELLESHLSYPVLAYFRSQHDNQSWLSALTTILDASALVLSGMEGAPARQARLTFAMARHAVVDLAQIFSYTPGGHPDRLPPDDCTHLRAALISSGLQLQDPDGQRLLKLRRMYEPYVQGLAEYLHMPLPQWIPAAIRKDNWETTAWDI